MKNNVSFLQVLSAAPAMARLDPVAALIDLLSGWTSLDLTSVSELALGSLTSSPDDAAILFAAAASGRLTARIRVNTITRFVDASLKSPRRVERDLAARYPQVRISAHKQALVSAVGRDLAGVTG